MKYKEVKVYQAVGFAKGQETFFSLENPRFKNANLEMEPVSWGIRIKTDKDEVIVSFNNVAYAKEIKEESEASEPKQKKPFYKV